MSLKSFIRTNQYAQDYRAFLNTATIVLCLLLAYSLFTHILIPATHSVYPLVLYRSGDTATNQDQYVTFSLNDSYLPGGKAQLVKRLGCISGQYLNRQGKQFYCNGKEIAQAELTDSKGHILSVFHYSGIIPEGKAFAVGDTINSYDSRYWGFIDISATEMLIPII